MNKRTIRIGTDWYEYSLDKEDKIIAILDRYGQRTEIEVKSIDLIQAILIDLSNHIWNLKEEIGATIIIELMKLGIKKISKK